MVILSRTASVQQEGRQQDRGGCAGSPDASSHPYHCPIPGVTRSGLVVGVAAKGIDLLHIVAPRYSLWRHNNQERGMLPHDPRIAKGAARRGSSGQAGTHRVHSRVKAKNAASINSGSSERWYPESPHTLRGTAPSAQSPFLRAAECYTNMDANQCDLCVRTK